MSDETRMSQPFKRATTNKIAPQAQQEERDMRGVLFWLNEKKSERHPDLTGRVRINGRVYGLSGWNRRSESGVDYISISVNAEYFNR